MIQLLCSGEFLDLPKEMKISFTNKNPLFAFDSISCERTTDFSIPSTPKNERIFSLAKIPAYSGSGMRRRFDAQMIDGVVVKNGYLYVDSYKDGTYKAIFVTGELIGLQAIRDAGSLVDLIDSTAISKLDNIATPMSMSSNVLWGKFNYQRKSGLLVPSFNLKKVVEMCEDSLEIGHVSFPDNMGSVRIIPPYPHGIIEHTDTFGSEIEDTTQPSSNEPQYGCNALDKNDTIFDYEDVLVPTTIRRESLFYKIALFKARQGVKITFPEDFPTDVYMVDFDGSSGAASSFYGEREFHYNTINQPATISGEPLRGRTVEVETGSRFIFVNVNDFVFTQEVIMGTTYYDNGFNFAQGSNLDFEYNLGVAGLKDKCEEGDYVRLVDNLPDVTYVELLKTIAAICGKSLYYTNADGVTFDSLDFATWGVFDITGKVKKYGEVSRKFSDYGQRNIVQFDSEEGVLDSSRIIRTYAIDNENITEEKELQTIPFSEGDKTFYGGQPVLYISKVDDAEKYTISRANAEVSRLQRVSIPSNGGIQALCNASTSIKVDLYLTLYDFERITPKTLLLLDGTRYVWTDAKWSNGVASFDLSKI